LGWKGTMISSPGGRQAPGARFFSGNRTAKPPRVSPSRLEGVFAAGTPVWIPRPTATVVSCRALFAGRAAAVAALLTFRRFGLLQKPHRPLPGAPALKAALVAATAFFSFFFFFRCWRRGGLPQPGDRPRPHYKPANIRRYSSFPREKAVPGRAARWTWGVFLRTPLAAPGRPKPARRTRGRRFVCFFVARTMAVGRCLPSPGRGSEQAAPQDLKSTPSGLPCGPKGVPAHALLVGDGARFETRPWKCRCNAKAWGGPRPPIFRRVSSTKARKKSPWCWSAPDVLA